MKKTIQKEKENNYEEEKRNDLMKILENINEDNSEEKKPKRRNSFNCLNILKKNKKEEKNTINKKNTKDNECQNNNKFKLISLLQNNFYKKNNSYSENSLSLKSKEKSERTNKTLSKKDNKSLKNNMNKRYSIGKGSILSSKSFKTSFCRNFVPKSELLKLNKNENSNNKINEKEKSEFNMIFTQRTKYQDEFNNNQFFHYLFDKYDNTSNLNKKNISSNTYIDDIEEENKDKNYLNNIIEENNMNNILKDYENSNNLINNYTESQDSNEEKYSMKNIYENNLNINNIKNEFQNYDKTEKIEKVENKNNTNEKSIETPPNNLIQDKFIEENLNNILKDKYINIKNENNINNFFINNISQNDLIFNNNINNNPFIFQNSQNHGMNFVNKNSFYSSTQSPLYYQNNMPLFSYYNNKTCNNYFTNYNNYNINNYFYSNNMNTMQPLNGFKQYNTNNIDMNKFNTKNNDFILENIFGLIRTQCGCIMLQEKIIEDHKFANELLFPLIKNNLKDICCDIFGNSFIKTLLDVLTIENIDLFLSSIKDSLYDICMTEPGSRVIQNLIEKINDSPLLLNKFIYYLSNKNIGLIINSPYGNHIFQKYLTIIKKKEFTNFIYNYIFNNFINIIKEKHGVCVIQKCLLEADDDQRNIIIEKIVNNFEIIIKDSYGNFLMQYIFTKFDKRKFDEILPIIIKLEEKIVDYCKNKNSASVIEKCFEKGDAEVSVHVMKYLLEKHSSSLKDIIFNQYGFYVIRKSILIPNKKIKKEIMKALINRIDKLKETNNGRKLIFIFSSEYKEFSDLLASSNKNHLENEKE